MVRCIDRTVTSAGPDGRTGPARVGRSPARSVRLVRGGRALQEAIAELLHGLEGVAVDGQPVSEFNDLISYLVFQTEVGQTITLTVLRNDQTLELPLTLGERP